jgi:hypothetical protein
VQQQFFEVGEGRGNHPEGIALVVEQLRVGFDRRDDHPVKRKQQHEQEHAERDVQRDPAAGQRLEELEPGAFLIFGHAR